MPKLSAVYTPRGSGDYLSATEKEDYARAGTPFLITDASEQVGKFGDVYEYEIIPQGETDPRRITLSAANRTDEYLAIKAALATEPVGPVKLERVTTKSGNVFYAFVDAE